jgi:hypothetical protein
VRLPGAAAGRIIVALFHQLCLPHRSSWIVEQRIERHLDPGRPRPCCCRAQGRPERLTTDGNTPFAGFSKFKRAFDAKVLAELRKQEPEAKPLPNWTDLRRPAQSLIRCAERSCRTLSRSHPPWHSP